MSYYIYKICCDNLLDYVYVGSTRSIRHRKYQHKYRCNNENDKAHYNNKLYTTIRANGGWDNFRMVLIEDLGKVSFTNARIREEHWRIELKANLNMQKCHITEEEFKEDKKEYDKKYSKKYRENNRDIINQKATTKTTCECGKTFNITNKTRHEQSLIHKKYTEN